jgi:uncharacterized protein YegP (UPF0339 family)
MVDDYLKCKSYEGHPADQKNEGFSLFEKSGKFYFSYQKGSLLLRSEGYADASSRTKGIAAVKKNLEVRERWNVEEVSKKYYLVLKSGNRKEIGRSCDFSSKAKADEALKLLFEKSTHLNLQNYLEVDQYLNRPRIWDSYGITGYVKFQHEDGKHYFGVYNPDATLYLRSEGFYSEEDRDIAFDLMDSIILLEENYRIENINGRYYAVLFEGEDIVAISPDFGSFIDAFVTTPGGRPREIQGTMY